MSTLETLPGGIQVPTPVPANLGGQAIASNFEKMLQWHPQSVWNQTSDPAANDDQTQGYQVGSLWLNTDSNRLWLCTNADDAAAVWQPIGSAIADTAANLATVVPAAGELAYETDTKRTVIGDGSTAVASLIRLAAVDLIQNANGSIQLGEGGDPRGEHAVDLGVIRSNDSQIASGRSAFKCGQDTTASGGGSHAEGIDTVASANSSHAEGSGTIASGSISHAEGVSTLASGSVSHAEGISTTASDEGSHSEGEFTIASGVSAHAEGAMTAAHGFFAHAEGNSSQANTSASHAEGTQSATRLNSQHAHACGRFSSTRDCQNTRFQLRGSTTDATVTELTTPERFAIEDEKAYAVTVTMLARQDTGANHAMYKCMVMIQRTAGTVALAGNVQTIGTDIETNANWNISLSADDTNKSLKVDVTGDAAQNIRWTALIEAVELGYSD